MNADSCKKTCPNNGMRNQHCNKINQAVTKPKISLQKLFKPIFLNSKLIQLFYVPFPFMTRTHEHKKNSFEHQKKQKEAIKKIKSKPMPIKQNRVVKKQPT